MRPYDFGFEQTRARRTKAIAMPRPISWHGVPPARCVPAPPFWDTALALLATWRKRLRERRELAALDYQMQRDISLTPQRGGRRGQQALLAGVTADAVRRAADCRRLPARPGGAAQVAAPRPSSPNGAADRF